MCLILNVSGSRRLSYDRMEGPVGRSLSGTRTGRRRRARGGLGSRRCAAAARSRELRRGRIVAPPAPENPGWEREGRKQGGRQRRQPGGERRPPRRKRPRAARTKTPSSDLPVRGSPSTSGCACVCVGGCVRPWRGPGLTAPSDAGPGRGASRRRRSPPFARSVFKTGLVVTVAAASSRVMASRGPSTPRIGRAPLRPLLPVSRPPPDRPVLPPKPYKGFTFSPAFSLVGDG